MSWSRPGATGESPGVAEISRRAVWSWKGDAGKGEPGSVARSIAWGIVLKLFRAGGVRRCAKSPGCGGYEPTEPSGRTGLEGFPTTRPRNWPDPPSSTVPFRSRRS